VISDDESEQIPCSACGEPHPPSKVERLFIQECERRSLPWQWKVMPVKAQKVASLTSVLVSPIEPLLCGAPGIPAYVLAAMFSLAQDLAGGDPAEAPGLLPYYAAALTALAQEADERAEEMFTGLLGDLPEMNEEER
jgi:hypothetical protein